MPLVSDVPEQANNPAVPLTRRERRAHAQTATPALPRRALLPRPLSIAATVAFAALVALTGYASPQFVALAVGLAGLVLAWGWPLLLSLPSPRGTSTVLAVGTLLMTGTALLTRDNPYLEWMPAALAVAVIVAFLHQLMRRDGRPRLTESIAATTSGLAIISAGTALAPIPHVLAGDHALAAAMAGLGIGALADPCVSIARLRQWALFISMVLGGGAAIVVSLVAGTSQLMVAPAGLLGLLAAGISHAARRVLAPLPATAMPRAQLAVAAASSLLVGVVAYVVVRYTVA
jgi:hypothetical protein